MDIFFWLILGAIAGFFAYFLLPKRLGTKMIGDILGGATGAIIGRIIAVPFGGATSFTTVLFSLLGILIGIGIARSLRL